LKIGIYGGSFNPIHLGHTSAAKQVAERLNLDRIYLIPAGIPPHKQLDIDTPSAVKRLEMVKMAAESLEYPAETLDIEIKRKGKSYTLDTLRELKKQLPKDHLYLLMGTDMFLCFQDWKHAEKIAKLCTLCVFSRDSQDVADKLEAQKKRLKRTIDAKVKIVPFSEIIDISSTQLRESLRKNESMAKQYLLPEVYGYILREGLYGTHVDLKNLSLEDLRCISLTHLKRSRFSHVLGTEETAAALARRWGADEESARRAALLHDCTKRLDREQHLALCRQYNIPIDEHERREANLLHALTGAVIAREVYGVSQEVESAIRWHTTGKADMTLLEKIIYLADYMEPTRDFCDLSELRMLAYQDLDQALLLGLTMAVELLNRKKMPVHSNSVYARDYLKGKLT